MVDDERAEDRDEVPGPGGDPGGGDEGKGRREALGPSGEADEAPGTAEPAEGAPAVGPAAAPDGDHPDGGSPEPQPRRALYVAVAALVVAVAALVVSWTAGGDRVEARSVSVVDGEGRARAVLGVDDAGRVSLRLLDPSGRVAATLEAGDASPELNLRGREGQIRLGLGDVIQNGGGLSFYDAGDRLRVGLAFSPGVGSNLVLGDDAGNIGVQVALDPQGPFVTLRAPDGSVMWAMPEEAPAEPEAGPGE